MIALWLPKIFNHLDKEKIEHLITKVINQDYVNTVNLEALSNLYNAVTNTLKPLQDLAFIVEFLLTQEPYYVTADLFCTQTIYRTKEELNISINTISWLLAGLLKKFEFQYRLKNRLVSSKAFNSKMASKGVIEQIIDFLSETGEFTLSDLSFKKQQLENTKLNYYDRLIAFLINIDRTKELRHKQKLANLLSELALVLIESNININFSNYEFMEKENLRLAANLEDEINELLNIDTHAANIVSNVNDLKARLNFLKREQKKAAETIEDRHRYATLRQLEAMISKIQEFCDARNADKEKLVKYYIGQCSKTLNLTNDVINEIYELLIGLQKRTNDINKQKTLMHLISEYKIIPDDFSVDIVTDTGESQDVLIRLSSVMNNEITDIEIPNNDDFSKIDSLIASLNKIESYNIELEDISTKTLLPVLKESIKILKDAGLNVRNKYYRNIFKENLTPVNYPIITKQHKVNSSLNTWKKN